MRDNLLRSAVSVFLFWWVVMSFKSLFGESEINWTPTIFVSSLSISAMSVTWGLLVAVSAFFMPRIFVKTQLVGESNKGMGVNLGPFPRSRKSLPRIKMDTEWGPGVAKWIKVYGQQYPKHLKLLEIVGEIIEAHPLLPASVEPGGHGDCTLLQHSHNVAEYMIKMCPDYEYKGLKIQGTAQFEEPLDPLYEFSIHDPLIPLVGLVHDLGKIECYEVTNEGEAIEKRSQHDWRGRYLLTTIKEFWDLPEGDREALLDTVGFYHHSRSLPINVKDRPRALIDLVLMADNAAGEHEAKHPRMATAEDIYDMVRRMLIARGEDPSKAVHPDRDISYDTKVGGVDLSLHQSRLLYYFEELIAQVDVVNGGDPDKRLGIKIGNIIYFNEEPVRERLGKILMAKRLIESEKGDKQKILTTRLMEVLELRGSLVNKVNEHTFGPSRSLFKLVTRSTKGKKNKEYVFPAVFLVDANAYKERGLDKIADVSLEVISVTPIYGWNQARIKPPKTKSFSGDDVDIPLIESNIESESPGLVIEDVVDEVIEPIHADDVIVSDEDTINSIHEAGRADLATELSTAISKGEAIPTKKEKTPDKKKRDKRHEARESQKSSSPVASDNWWELDDGKELAFNVLATFRDCTTQVQRKSELGYMRMDLVLKLLQIHKVGEEKVRKILEHPSHKNSFTIKQNSEGVMFIGIPIKILDNP